MDREAGILFFLIPTFLFIAVMALRLDARMVQVELTRTACGGAQQLPRARLQLYPRLYLRVVWLVTGRYSISCFLFWWEFQQQDAVYLAVFVVDF